MVDNDSEKSTQLRKEVKMNSFSSNYRNVILIPNEAGLKLIESFEPNNDLRQVLIPISFPISWDENASRAIKSRMTVENLEIKTCVKV